MVPAVTPAQYRTWIIVIVVFFAVGSMMNIANLGPARGRLVIADKAAIQIGISPGVVLIMEQYCFDPMAECFQHLRNMAFVGKTHNDKTSVTAMNNQ